MGTNNRYEGGTEYNVSDKIIHENYIPILNNDIAVLKTSKKIEFSKLVEPISLPRRNPALLTSIPVTFAGWGANKASNFNKM